MELLWRSRSRSFKNEESESELLSTDSTVLILQRTGWAPEAVWTATENYASTGIRCPDSAARSESLYRLSPRGSPTVTYTYAKLSKRWCWRDYHWYQTSSPSVILNNLLRNVKLFNWHLALAGNAERLLLAGRDMRTAAQKTWLRATTFSCHQVLKKATDPAMNLS
jgi:hypothetical protein